MQSLSSSSMRCARDPKPHFTWFAITKVRILTHLVQAVKQLNYALVLAIQSPEFLVDKFGAAGAPPHLLALLVQKYIF